MRASSAARAAIEPGDESGLLLSSGPKLPFGLTHDRLNTELYAAWRKDVREFVSPESQKRFRELMERGLRDREVVLRSAGVGVNVTLSLASLLAHTSVAKLDLHHNLIGDAGCEAVAHLLREAFSLTHVNLGGNDIGPAGIQVLSAVLASRDSSSPKKLQTLILGTGPKDQHVNRIDPASGKLLIEACMRVKTLKVLDLNRNPLGRGSQEAFPVLVKLIQGSNALQILRLGHTEMSTDSALGLLPAVQRSSSLAELDFSGNNLNHKLGEALGTMLSERGRKPTPSPLKVLHMHDNPHLGNRGAVAMFRGLASDKGLTTLTVSNCGVDDDAVFSLCASLATNGTLTSLDLTANDISHLGATELAKALVPHPALQTLSLAKNKVRDDGTCAIAAMLEHNHVIDTLDLEETWVSDRGAVALGVALANNTTMRELNLQNNHISEEGGSALVALLERNHSVQSCSLKGNGVYHNTVLQGNRVLARNRQAKEDEMSNRLRKDVVKLHYQLYKLSEAKADLQAHKNKKDELANNEDRFDQQVREEDIAFVKQKKELEEKLREAENEAERLDKDLKDIQERFKRDVVTNQQEMERLQERLELEEADCKKAEADLKAVEQEVALAASKRQDKVDELKAKIEAAKADRNRWIAQTKQYRAAADAAAATLRELEEKRSVNAAAKAADTEAKKAAKAAGKPGKPAEIDIEAQLAALS